MLILSWNLQKITAAKAAQFAPLIGELVTMAAGDNPFVLIVYENKTRAEDVVSSIGSGIKASDIVTFVARTGGEKGLAENILVIAGNGASFDKPEPFTGWQGNFGERCKRMHAGEKDAAQSHVARLASMRPTRSSTAEARAAFMESVEKGTFRPVGAFRNPIALTVRCSGFSAKVLALHAPGPDDGDEHEVPYEAGLLGVRIHDLRHSLACHVAGMSETLPMIGKLLGHAKIASTARYTHLDDKDNSLAAGLWIGVQKGPP